MISRLPLFPVGSSVNQDGHLVIGGCDAVDLAAEFGTPLYVYDEDGLRAKCREFLSEFGGRYADVVVAYSGKAFLNNAMAQLIKEEGLGLDVVSGGELGIADAAGFPMDRVYFPGNNKSAAELAMALDLGVGRIVVDNFDELEMLGELTSARGKVVDVLLRVTPGVDPHTHRHIVTGNIDSKFGIPLVQAEEAVTRAMALPGVNPVGLHSHIGSQIFENEPFVAAVATIIGLAVEMKRKHGFEMTELDVGGGYAVQYTLDAPAPPVYYDAAAITARVIAECEKYGLPLPRLIIEPGRSLVARAGVALYTAGVVKDIPGVRRYVSVDGGMADNIRPALYDARHEAVVANKMEATAGEKVTIAGKYCEAGDVLIHDIALPPVAAGDTIAVAGCGAYCIPESMNYNASFRPAVIQVSSGKARLIRRREILDDLTRLDVT